MNNKKKVSNKNQNIKINYPHKILINCFISNLIY